MSMNHVWLSGFLAKTPELRYTKAGLPVLNFLLATKNRVQNETTGKWVNRSIYINCSLFGTRAPNVAAVLHKGSKVAVEGKLRECRWNSKKDGSLCRELEVTLETVELLNRD